jgi:hypothetical protein
MTVYSQVQKEAVLWTEPMESIWQQLSYQGQVGLAKKMPHLNLADVFFIGAVVNIPRSVRPWGSITWVAEMFQISRVSVYNLGRQLAQRWQGWPQAKAPTAETPKPASVSQLIEVSPNRVARTILTAAFPGSISIRPLQQVLRTAFDQSRGVGTISELLTQAGQQAGQVLSQIDTSCLGSVIVARDETFFGQWPILLVIDPISTTILLALVSPDRQADTWGLALLLAQDQGATIVGLVEDMARMYDKSRHLIQLELPVQKDPWHLEQEGRKIKQELERAALRAMQQEERLTQKLLNQWTDELFYDQYVPAVEKLERLLEQVDQFSQAFGHLCDALELVDWRSGEIRDRQINGWLLAETIKLLAQIEQPRVKSFVKSLGRYQDQLLTYLDWLAAALTPYQQHLADQISSVKEQRAFSRTVARAWRLKQALRNGQAHFRKQAQAAQAALDSLLADDPSRTDLAEQLLRLLEAACHTTSLIETINGLLQSFLKDRRTFATLETAQAYLNLFTLWHNMRVYERGKRAGSSPYQLAGIEPGAEDWLELLGYPAD